jgi:hypothetical protein
MLSPQPIQLVKYLCLKRNKVPSSIKRLFYLSFEDALWDILKKKNVKTGSVILLPDFYCTDVEINIKNHKYGIIHYQIKQDLSANLPDFESKIKIYKPDVIVIFHPDGITSNLMQERNWMNQISNQTIVIEDCVHRIINPRKIKIHKKNHFIINSLRKVAPFQGSSVYGRKEDLKFGSPPLRQSLFYSVKVHFLWLAMNICYNLEKSELAEKLMIRGYDLIGDSFKPARGFFIFERLEEYLDIVKIEKIKEGQIEFYEENLKFPIVHPAVDRGKLRGYPLILKKEIADEVLKNIRAKGLTLRFELNDCEWSQKQKIIYLPIGPYLKKSELSKICGIVNSSRRSQFFD